MPLPDEDTAAGQTGSDGSSECARFARLKSVMRAPVLVDLRSVRAPDDARRQGLRSVGDLARRGD
ncbi:MAG: hypothetical protein PGN25_04275 [Methylorubrum populi]